MKTTNRYLLPGIVAVCMVAAFLGGMLSADMNAKASALALTKGQKAALQGSYNFLLSMDLRNKITLPLVIKP